MCESWAFDEINLNCGCPSTKVADRCFGARLMLVRDTVAVAATDFFSRTHSSARIDDNTLQVCSVCACPSRCRPFGSPSYRQWLVTLDTGW